MSAGLVFQQAHVIATVAAAAEAEAEAEALESNEIKRQFLGWMPLAISRSP